MSCREKAHIIPTLEKITIFAGKRGVVVYEQLWNQPEDLTSAAETIRNPSDESSTTDHSSEVDDDIDDLDMQPLPSPDDHHDGATSASGESHLGRIFS